MLRIRIFEEKIAEKYPEGEIRCPVHLSIGQEAVAVGVCACLKKTDIVMGGHRSHAHYLAKGGNAFAMLAELYGKEAGCCKGRGGSMHLIDLNVNFLGSTPIVGGSIPIATGCAWAEKMKRRKTLTAVFFGEAAVEEGIFHEAVNFASLKKLPIVYVCENNLYSVYTPLSLRQPFRSIARLVKGHNVTVFSGDGNNCLEVYETVKKAIKLIRTGCGPVFLEFATYRHLEHCGPGFDNSLGYRTEKEFLYWKKKDPITHLKAYLMKQNLLTEEQDTSLRKSFNQDLEVLFQKVKVSPEPKMAVTDNDVYAKN